MWQTYLTVALVAYLLGSIPFGYILVKLFLKQDIRTTGSGNIGATNVARSGKKGLAIATLLLDAGKGALAVYLVLSWYRATYGGVWVLDCWVCHDSARLMLFAALFAVIGHVFPVWLRFRGGKGVATALGGLLVVNPAAVLACFVVFAIVFALTRFVSLSSLSAAFVYPFAVLLLDSGHPVWWAAWPSIPLCLLIILKHHDNILRLLNGTEPKFGVKKVAPSDPIQVEKNA
jgi:acyl phosphate:glycerol-3-phosphate acyltransferase